MVLIHCKYKGEEHSFLYETTVEINVKDLIKELVEVHNLRLRLQRLKSEGDDLASHGPCKPLDKQGLDEDIQAEADGIELPPRGPTYCKDPIGKRTGDAPVTPAQATLRKALDDAAAAASKKQVEAKHPLTKKELMEHIDLIRGAVMIAYPMGLPEYDPVRIGEFIFIRALTGNQTDVVFFHSQTSKRMRRLPRRPSGSTSWTKTHSCGGRGNRCYRGTSSACTWGKTKRRRSWPS